MVIPPRNAAACNFIELRKVDGWKSDNFMNYQLLGKSGLRVSELCLGTMTFGDRCDEAESHAILSGSGYH